MTVYLNWILCSVPHLCCFHWLKMDGNAENNYLLAEHYSRKLQNWQLMSCQWSAHLDFVIKKNYVPNPSSQIPTSISHFSWPLLWLSLSLPLCVACTKDLCNLLITHNNNSLNYSINSASTMKSLDYYTRLNCSFGQMAVWSRFKLNSKNVEYTVHVCTSSEGDSQSLKHSHTQ